MDSILVDASIYKIGGGVFTWSHVWVDNNGLI